MTVAQLIKQLQKLPPNHNVGLMLYAPPPQPKGTAIAGFLKGARLTTVTGGAVELVGEAQYALADAPAMEEALMKREEKG